MTPLLVVRMSWSSSVDDGVESVMLIGGVVDGSDRAVRFDQGVRSLYNIAVSCLMLTFYVTCLVVVHAIFKCILRVRLIEVKKII